MLGEVELEVPVITAEVAPGQMIGVVVDSELVYVHKFLPEQGPALQSNSEPNALAELLVNKTPVVKNSPFPVIPTLLEAL